MVYDSIFITIYIQKVSQTTVELNGLENNLTTEVSTETPKNYQQLVKMSNWPIRQNWPIRWYDTW
jgi:hypothetical protein